MKRFAPLDIYRGLTVCLMIIVNTTGDWNETFSPLLHAAWHGFTPTDWVFPSFLFAVGTSFAFVKSRWADKTLGDVFGKIVKRTLIIFFLGYIMYWFPFVEWTADGNWVGKPFSETRIMGVLQRIALCYFFAAILIFYLNKRQLLIASGVILVGYWMAMYGFGDYTMEGNFAHALDHLILGDAHLYKGEGVPFDPEGLFSTLPAIVNVLGGYLTGVYLIDGEFNYEKLAKLLLVGCGLLVLAYVWDLAFPINKKLWTSSFVVFTVGLSILVLSMIIYTMEFMKKPINYYFFEVFGKNALALYLFSEYFASSLLFLRVDGKQSFYNYIYENAFGWLPPYWSAFAFAFVFMMICWAFGWWLDKRKVYIRV